MFAGYIMISHVEAPDLLSPHTAKDYSRFYPPPDEVGGGGIGVVSDVRPSARPSGVRIFVSGAELCNPSMGFSNF